MAHSRKTSSPSTAPLPPEAPSMITWSARIEPAVYGVLISCCIVKCKITGGEDSVAMMADDVDTRYDRTPA